MSDRTGARVIATSQPGTMTGSASGANRTMLLVVHTGRPDAVRTGRIVAERLGSAGVTVRVLKSEADDLRCPDAEVMPVSPQAAHDAEMVLVIGGDGTLLRAAEIARPAGTPLLGVNLGHVGFLAETEPEVLSDAVDHVLAGSYYVELGAERGDSREGGQGANAGPGNRGRRQAAVPVGLRRPGVRDSDRLYCLRVLGRRPGRLAGRRGTSAGAD
jgi:hypothetical protein